MPRIISRLSPVQIVWWAKLAVPLAGSMVSSPGELFGGDVPFSHTGSNAATCSNVRSHGDCFGEELGERVGVVSVVVLVATFNNVSCCVLLAVVVMTSINRPLDEAPKTFNRVRVNQTLRVGYSVIDSEVGNPFVHPIVATIFVGDEYAIISTDYACQERFERLARNSVRRLGNNFAPACYSTDNGLLLCASTTLGSIVVIFLATPGSCYERLISLYDPIQEHAIVCHPLANLHSHPPSSGRCQFQIAGKLQAGDVFLGVQYDGNAKKPLLQRNSGALENRARQDVVAIVALMTVPATYSVILALAGYAVATAERAHWAVAPTRIFKMVNTSLLCRKLLEDCNEIHVRYPLCLYDIHSIADNVSLVKPQT